MGLIGGLISDYIERRHNDRLAAQTALINEEAQRLNDPMTPPEERARIYANIQNLSAAMSPQSHRALLGQVTPEQRRTGGVVPKVWGGIEHFLFGRPAPVNPMTAPTLPPGQAPGTPAVLPPPPGAPGAPANPGVDGALGQIPLMTPEQAAEIQARQGVTAARTRATGFKNILGEENFNKLNPVQQVNLAEGKNVPMQSVGFAPGKINGAQLNGMLGTDQYDPREVYSVQFDHATGQLISAVPQSVQLHQGPTQQNEQGDFVRPLFNPYTGQANVNLSTLPPPGMVGHERTNSSVHWLQNPDGSFSPVPVTTTSTSRPILPPPPGAKAGGRAVATSGVPSALPPPPISQGGRGSRGSRGGQAAQQGAPAANTPVSAAPMTRGSARVGTPGPGMGGKPPTDRAKSDFQNVDESIKLGNQIKQMIDQLPTSDREAGTLDQVLQAAGKRAGAKAYAAGLSAGHYGNRLYALIDRLDAMGRKALQTGGPRAVAYSEVIAQHLPRKTDTYPLIVDKLDAMMEGLQALRKSDLQLTPQLNKLIQSAPVQQQQQQGMPGTPGTPGKVSTAEEYLKSIGH